MDPEINTLIDSDPTWEVVPHSVITVDADEGWEYEDEDGEGDDDGGSILDEIGYGATSAPINGPAPRAKRKRAGRTVRSTNGFGDGWWEAYKAKNKTLWTGTNGQTGARALSAWTGSWGGSYHSNFAFGGDNLAFYLTRAKRFASNLAGAVAKDALTADINWAAAKGSTLTPQQGAIRLNPEPIRRVNTKKLDELDAQSIVAGEAIHQAGHLAHTTGAWYTQVFDLASALDKSTNAMSSVAGLVEDAYVETTILDEYPGFQDYLAASWEDETRTKPLSARAAEAHAEWTKGNIAALLQGLTRSYAPPTTDETAQLAQLDANAQRTLRIGQRIFARAHNPTLPVTARVVLAEQLWRLLEDGTVPEEDHEAEGDEPTQPGSGPMSAIPAQCPTANPGMPSSADELSGNESEEANKEDGAERHIDSIPNPEPNPPDGAREVPVHWLNGTPNSIAYAAAAKAAAPYVRDLAKALRLRQNSPRRKLSYRQSGKLDGQRLAEAPLYARRDGPAPLFTEREILAAPRAGISLLLDNSGSMSSNQRDKKARIATAMMDLALQQIDQEFPGAIAWVIRAHTSTSAPVFAKAGTKTHEGEEQTEDGYNQAEVPLLLRILDAKHQDRDRIGAIEATDNNYDGEALLAVIREAERAWPDRERLLIHVSDGTPSGWSYGGTSAEERVQGLVNAARRKGTKVVNLFIGDMDTGTSWSRRIPASMTTMYGEEGRGWLRVPDVNTLPVVLSRLLTKILHWSA